LRRVGRSGEPKSGGRTAKTPGRGRAGEASQGPAPPRGQPRSAGRGAAQRADLTSDKDLYLDNSSVEEASGVYPIDDDDYSSGSGSGAEEDEDSAVITTSRTLPKIPTTSDASRAETTTMKMQTKMPAQTKSPEEIDKEERSETDAKKNSDEPGDDTDVFTEKHSENLFQRTEVLAAVIAGGVIGFLFAIFLILLLVYRMRKKDEGSYDLGERKPSSAAYQKAPTKEFYA
uniref:Syndecan n=1 Tax=Dromaius novaehollandiae TaxID=8790 RepID=A0A8C4JGH7_DRONO